MALILLMIIAALVLAIIGIVAKGLFYLLVISAILLLFALVGAALRWRRGGRRPVR